MTNLISYLLEANFCLLLFLMLYFLGLRNEHRFQFSRIYLLCGLVFSMLFPLIHLQGGSGRAFIPSIGNTFYMLPEVVIGNSKTVTVSTSALDITEFMKFIPWIYFTGVFFSGVIFLYQLFRLILLIINSKTYQWNNCRIAESTKILETFSFFNFIFLGQANKINDEEKQKILMHECIHAEQFHSLDILLLKFAGVIFWFNPFIRIYKKILIELHEFDADSRAVENYNLYEYCDLLGKVALQSVGFTLGNHFNKSLILKRIIMIQTVKRKITPWKIALLLAIFPIAFYLVSCEDKEKKEMHEPDQNLTQLYPDDVQNQLDELKKNKPNEKHFVVEAKSSEEVQEKTNQLLKEQTESISSVHVIAKKDENRFAIVSFKDSRESGKKKEQTEVKIFTTVEESAKFPGGEKEMLKFFAKNIRYPEESRKNGVMGKVFVEFVINEDGSVSDAKILQGLDDACDNKALRVVKKSSGWIPGKQQGIAVKQKFVLPLTFKINNEKNIIIIDRIGAADRIMSIESTKSIVDGKTIISGTVRSNDQKPLSGAIIVLMGSTLGTAADQNGNFRIALDKASGEIAVSYDGYKREIINF